MRKIKTHWLTGLTILMLGAIVSCAPKSAPLKAAAPPEPAGQAQNQETAEQVAQQPSQSQQAVIPQPYPGMRAMHYLPDASRSLGTETLLSELSKEVAGKVFYELKAEGEKSFTSRIAVVAAVPLADLKKETEFGRVMAEYLLTDLADRGLRVTELRLGRDINILPLTGEFIMSRNIGELASDLPELNYVVASTFTNTRKTLIVQGRLIDLRSGLVKSSWRYNLPLNRELLGLFQVAQQPHTIAVRGMRK